MTCRVEQLAERIEPGHAEAFERRQELLPDERDALHERIVGAVAGRVERAVEVVEHFEEGDDERAPAALDVLRQLLAQPRARLIELLGRAAVLGEQLLEFDVLLGELCLELLDVRRLELRLLGAARFFAARPPAPVGDFQSDQT